MACALGLRDNKVERLSHGFGRRMAEQAFAACVPEADDAVLVGIQDAVRRVGEKASLEVWDGHGLAMERVRLFSWRTGRTGAYARSPEFGNLRQPSIAPPAWGARLSAAVRILSPTPPRALL